MLDIQNVSKRYGALTAVSHVSFSIAPGEILGYLGPNGSGKSTTVKMLAGLISPTAGAILYKGRDIADDLLGYKAAVGYVPEEAHVYTHLTAPEYLRMCGRLRSIPPARLETKINNFLRLFELDTDYHAQLSAFSKGMRQKVLLAAALLHRPRVIILDEPVSGLDVSAALVLRGVVKALADAGAIVFYSSHELDTVERISSRVMILRSGQVVADDSASNLRTLMSAPSLEDVFSQLAVRDDVDRIANELVATVQL
jgi:ABC-2 type transport system ATP-binding protein